MLESRVPTYADFDDYRYSQRVAVVVRWFLLGTFLFLHNYRPDPIELHYFINNLLALSLAGLNGFVHWRILRDRPITRRYVLALSATDLAFITIGIGISSRFDNTFFVLYYPALLGMALVVPSRRVAFAATTAVVVAYGAISLVMEPGVSLDIIEERILLVRIFCMYAVVAAGNLITRIERSRRRAAVEAERERADENLSLQRRAREAELAAQEERSRIARDMHDGIAQSIYALTLGLETCSDLAERENSPLREQLQRLVPMAKNTLLESRYYIHDLRRLLSGETDLQSMAENHVKEFEMVAGVPVELTVEGQAGQVSVTAATAFYRILQEALANVLKHAQASGVQVSVGFEDSTVRLAVQDNGVGFDPENVSSGFGLDNMTRRADDLGGTFEVEAAQGKGTRVSITLPAQEVEREDG